VADWRPEPGTTQASRITEAPIVLGQNASMTILHADAGTHSSPNENRLVVRLAWAPPAFS
jgi:hypothetical protein